MSLHCQPTALVGAIALALGFTSSVQAAEQKVAKASLDTIVVTATRSEEKIENVPARISVIDEKTIQQSPIADLGSLLNREASINIVQSGGIGQTTSAFLRGTDSKHLLFLKDGVSLNTALDGGSNIPYIDLSDIERIEVLRGPASVQYGTDAIGGVINVISATPKKTGISLTNEIGENHTYKSIIGADFVDQSGLYAQIKGQRLESDGTPVTNKAKVNAGYDQKGYSAKLGLNKEKYSASLSFSENEGTNIYYGGSQDFLNQVLIAKASAQVSPNLLLNGQYSNFKDELLGAGNSYLFNTERDEADLSAKWKLSNTQHLLLGASLNQTNIESYSILGQKQDLDSIGYYVQHNYDTNKVHTQAGLRLEDHDEFGSHIVGQLAGRYNLNAKTSIYSNIGTGFKAPTGNQLYYSYDNATWGGTYGNPDLKPEESISYEIGLDHQLTNSLSLNAALYETQVDNLIDTRLIEVGKKDKTYDNIRKAQMQGGEFGLTWQKDDFFIIGEYAYVRTENKDTGLELIRRPRQSLSTTIGLENSLYGLSATLIAKSTSKISNVADSEEVPGYATVDLNGYWNLNPNIKLFSNIKNIGDVKFKTASYGGDEYYINGGRLASAGVTFKY
ncbi:TonB-dependent siderophore receptor [Acinetobacter sp. YH01008]|uniref:TonB-dependent receptor plug domain-containing protein n=1 Tax=Acinetobacter sp. YH01008 TaxID=2601024 RepID=UPI0015D0DE3F|nr:TonB-dependent receptor [Acinetobacter sp. YH01008]